MPLVQSKGVVPAVRKKESRCYVAIAPSISDTASAKVELASAAVKGANSLTIVDLPTIPILKRNFLLFKDPATELVYYPVQVRANYTGGTSLLIEPLAEDMPDTVEAMFFSELCYRTEQSNEGQRKSDTFETICHTIAEQIPGVPTYSGNFPGGYSYYDAGIKTLEYAALNGLTIVIEKRYPLPSPTGFRSGRVERGLGIPTFSGGESNGAEAMNFKIDYSAYTVVDAVVT